MKYDSLMPFMSSLLFSEEVPAVSYQLVTELLSNKNLRKDVDIAILECKWYQLRHCHVVILF